MIPAHYSLIRYVPDSARGEQLNVGILAWTDQRMALELDERALDRVVRENPHLAKDALRDLHDRIQEELAEVGGPPPDMIASWLANQRGYPVVATESRYTTIDSGQDDALDQTVERLLARIVRPRRRHGGPHADAAHILDRALQPYVRSRKILRDHRFAASRSGISRSVDYFANSGANVALDFVKLALAKPDEILRRADAEAFKIEDIRASNDISVVVFCDVSTEEKVRDATADARRVISSVGAQLVTSVDGAADAMKQAVG